MIRDEKLKRICKAYTKEQNESNTRKFQFETSVFRCSNESFNFETGHPDLTNIIL